MNSLEITSFNELEFICLHTVKCFQVLFYLAPRFNLTGTTTPGQSGYESNGKEGVLHIPQSSRTVASPSDGLVSYPEHLLEWGIYPSAEMQWAYSTAPADWALWLQICNSVEIS